MVVKQVESYEKAVALIDTHLIDAGAMMIVQRIKSSPVQ